MAQPSPGDGDTMTPLGPLADDGRFEPPLNKPFPALLLACWRRAGAVLGLLPGVAGVEPNRNETAACDPFVSFLPLLLPYPFPSSEPRIQGLTLSP